MKNLTPGGDLGDPQGSKVKGRKKITPWVTRAKFQTPKCNSLVIVTNISEKLEILERKK